MNITLGDGCHEKKVAIHEMMHAAGFFHEMSRRDRDTFIFVNYTNMRSGKHGIQWNLSIADMLYSGHLSIADIFHKNG